MAASYKDNRFVNEKRVCVENEQFAEETYWKTQGQHREAKSEGFVESICFVFDRRV